MKKTGQTLVMTKSAAQARIVRTDSAPDGDTLTPPGNRGVNDPWGRAGRSHRAEAGSVTQRVQSHLNRKGGRGRLNEKNGADISHDKERRAGPHCPDG